MQATTFSISARAIAALFVFSIGSACGERPGESPDSSLLHADSAGARAFVKSFYDWYGEGRLEEALGRDSLFAPQLASLLKEDLRLAGADTITPRMTLDGDPFVGQDPCLPYIPIGLAQKGDRFRVTMWPNCAGRNNPWGQPSTIEVARVDGQ